MLGSVTKFVNENVEALQRMEMTLVASKGWKKLKDDMQLFLGEALSGIGIWWAEFKENISRGILSALPGGLKFLIESYVETLQNQTLLDDLDGINKKIEEQNDIISTNLVLMGDLNTTDEERIRILEESIEANDIIHTQQRRLAEAQLTIIKGNKDEYDNIREYNKAVSDQELAIIQLTHAYENEQLATGIQIENLKTQIERTKELEREEAKLAREKALEKQTELERLLEEAMLRTNMRFEDRLSLLKQLAEMQDEYWRKQESYQGAITQQFDFEDEETIYDDGELLAQKLEDTRVYYDSVEVLLSDHTMQMISTWQAYFKKVQEFFEQDLEFAKLTTDQKVQTIAAGATLALSIAGMLVDEMGAAASDSFETQKKYNQASIVIDTLMGAVTAFATSMELGPIAGPIVGGVLAALVVGLGATAYSKVGKTTQDNHPGMDIGTGGQSAPAPSFSLIQPYGSGQQAQLEQTNVKQEPVQAYVIGDSVETQSALDRQTRKNATF